jgi:hypothetical protein
VRTRKSTLRRSSSQHGVDWVFSECAKCGGFFGHHPNNPHCKKCAAIAASVKRLKRKTAGAK